MSKQLLPDESPLPLKIQNEIVDHFNAQKDKLGTWIDAKTETGAKVAAQLDRTLISLSGGALILSMTFVDKIAPAKLEPRLLFAAWLAFGGSMVAVMFAMRAEQKLIHNAIIDASKQYATLDELEKAALINGNVKSIVPGPVIVSRGVGIFNLIAIAAFILGAVLLGGFVAYNINNAPVTIPTHSSGS